MSGVSLLPFLFCDQAAHSHHIEEINNQQWRSSWYSFLDLLDIDYGKGFTCNNSQPYPDTLSCDATTEVYLATKFVGPQLWTKTTAATKNQHPKLNKDINSNILSNLQSTLLQELQEREEQLWKKNFLRWWRFRGK